MINQQDWQLSININASVRIVTKSPKVRPLYLYSPSLWIRQMTGYKPVGGAFGLGHVGHELLDDLHEVLLGDHAGEQVQGAQADRVVRVVQAGHYQILNTFSTVKQCSGSMTFWCGSGSGSADPCLWLMDPAPAIFVMDLQEANKKPI